MKRISIFIASGILLGLILSLFLPTLVKRKEPALLSPLPQDMAVYTNTDRLEEKSTATVSSAPTFLAKPMHILLLGLDGRSGDKNPRCDAIHILSFNSKTSQITITSIPRGTAVKIEGVPEESAYLSNSCHIKGIDFAVEEIKKITGITPNYLVKVGFSQTLGILRSLNLPTTSTLQFLRNRRFGLGDYQRVHNQAIFFKDIFMTHFEEFAALPKVVKYLIFQTIDTDLPFETALALFDQIKASGAYKDPEKIKLVTKPIPNYKTRDLHFDPASASSTAQLSQDSEFAEYQTNLIGNLSNLISRGDKFIQTNQLASAYNLAKIPFSQQLWLQIEDEDIRNKFHFAMLRIYALSSGNKNASSLVLDFITEMEETGEEELKTQAEELLSRLNGNF